MELADRDVAAVPSSMLLPSDQAGGVVTVDLK